ncbi:MAG: hypothetical protein ABIK28_03515 [Planctomycetota bacterium]
MKFFITFLIAFLCMTLSVTAQEPPGGYGCQPSVSIMASPGPMGVSVTTTVSCIHAGNINPMSVSCVFKFNHEDVDTDSAEGPVSNYLFATTEEWDSYMVIAIQECSVCGSVGYAARGGSSGSESMFNNPFDAYLDHPMRAILPKRDRFQMFHY